jgi:hypothetical protein
MKKLHIEFIASKMFIIGLIVLIINDNILKYIFPGFITGKLSDLSGLFIFPIFFSIFWYKNRKVVYILTALLFTFWKSSLSQPIINFCNNYFLINVSRTVDYSDLFTMLILPFSYYYVSENKFVDNNIGFIKALIIGSFTIITFCATTVPRTYFEKKIDLNKKYKIPISKTEFFNSVHYAYGYSDTIEKNMGDSLFYCYYDIPKCEAHIDAVVKITQPAPDSLCIEMDSIVGYTIYGRFLWGIKKKNKDFMDQLTSHDYEKYFEENYINVLTGINKYYTRDLFFDNKELIDQFIKRRN